MTAVAAGALRHYVTIEAPLIQQDPDTGEMLQTWGTFAECWAAVLPSSGREFLAAAAEQSEVRGKIIIRYREGIDASMRVLHRGQYFGILAVLHDNDSGIEHISLMVSEGVRLDQ